MWQGYAVRTLATHSKELLEVIPATEVTSMPLTVGIDSIQGDAKVDRSIQWSNAWLIGLEVEE